MISNTTATQFLTIKKTAQAGYMAETALRQLVNQGKIPGYGGMAKVLPRPYHPGPERI